MIVAGVDEAGRGPLAGPVVAAAAVLTRDQRDILKEAGLNDSKRLTPVRRERIFGLMQKIDVVWRAQAASPERIDRDNILRATLWCMRRAVERLSVQPSLVIVDGSVKIPDLPLSQKAVPKADSLVPCVAAASVVAKVLRDRAMLALDGLYPAYGFSAHKGYPSSAHIRILKQLGPCPFHRRSYRPVQEAERE
ncbi:MAG: ribonuclease HII [Synergistota bacterium]|nr:ribonuclease HII [Synergistota bacterium]